MEFTNSNWVGDADDINSIVGYTLSLGLGPVIVGFVLVQSLPQDHNLV
jgi:hypothetical protein